MDLQSVRACFLMVRLCQSTGKKMEAPGREVTYCKEKGFFLYSLLRPYPHFCSPYVWMFPPSSSLTPAGCPTGQFSSDTVYLKLASNPTSKGSVPQVCPHFRCQSGVQVVTCASDQSTVNQGSYGPSLGSVIYLLEQLPELRETLSYVSQFII